MDLTQTKIVVMVILGVIKLISGLVPLLLTKILEKRSERILRKFIGAVLCFGGGVLLSTVFIHMFSEVRDTLERATVMGTIPADWKFPFGELLFCVGFLLILLIESVVHNMFGTEHQHSDSNKKGTAPKEKCCLSVMIENHTSDNCDNSKKIVETQDTTTEYPDEPKRNCILGNCSVSNPLLESNKSYNADSEAIYSESSPLPKSDKTKKTMNTILSSLRGLLVVIALSVHCLFEGMAIGLEDSESCVWKLFLAISIHSIPIVFCIGTEMISTGTQKSKIIIYMIVLSLVTPAGVLLGILLTVHMEEATGAHILLIGVLQGLAGGTLLYITFFEVLAQDKLRKYGMCGLSGSLMILLGFTLMTVMEASSPGHSHGGSQSGEDKQ